MVSSLGASVLAVGLIDGIAEATANIVKVFSGTISDFLNKRKALTVFGYALSAFSKPLFPLATTVSHIVTARIADRIGKGIRGAPRDALMADIAPPHLLGASYGLRQSLDTAGAFIGPLLAIALMAWTHGNFRIVFWAATIPAILAVVALIAGVHEPGASGKAKPRPSLRWSDLRSLSREYWWIVAIGGIFTLSRFSEAFLVLRAQNIGIPIALVPVVMVVMNIAYSPLGVPRGSPCGSHEPPGIALCRVGCFLLLRTSCWLSHPGCHCSLPVYCCGGTYGTDAGTVVCDGCRQRAVRVAGTAFGFFNLVSGIALLPASGVAGLLWTWTGPSATFLCGGAFAVLTLFVVIGTIHPRANSGR
jgi:hypothetical protein